MKNFSPYTDLALEVAESLTNNADNDLEGLKIFTEDCEMEKTSVTSVEITSPIGEEKMGRPMGTYITLESVFKQPWSSRKINCHFKQTFKPTLPS